MPPPKDISRGEAGDTTPAPAGTPDGIDLNGGDGDGGTPPSPKKEDGVDLKNFVPKKDFDDLEGKNKHLFERAKKAEAKLKEKGIALEEDPPTPPAQPASSADPFSLAKQVGALKDYDEQEIDFASFIAKGKGVSAAEAIKTPEFETYLKGKRGADYKRSTVPSPGAPASPSLSLPDAAAIGKMSKDEHMKLDQEAMQRQMGSGRGV